MTRCITVCFDLTNKMRRTTRSAANAEIDVAPAKTVAPSKPVAPAKIVEDVETQRQRAREWAENQGAFKGKKTNPTQSAESSVMKPLVKSRKSTPSKKRPEYISPPEQAIPSITRTSTRRKKQEPIEETQEYDRHVSESPPSPVVIKRVANKVEVSSNTSQKAVALAPVSERLIPVSKLIAGIVMLLVIFYIINVSIGYARK